MRLVKIKLALVDKDHLITNYPYVSDAAGQWGRKLISVSSLKRTVSLDRRFERGGFSFIFNDTDLTLQTMFANDTYRKIYGRIVTMYVMAADGVTVAETVIGSIHGWSRKYSAVEFQCVQEFSGAMDAIPPAIDKIITLATFPNATAGAVGQPVLFPAGVCVNQWGWLNPIWQVKLNGVGVVRSYLLTWSDPLGPARIVSLGDVWEIYGDHAGVLLTPADYSLTRDAAGWEYIEFANGWTGQLRANVTARSDPAQTGYNPVVALRAVLTNAGVTLVDDGAGGTDDFKTFCTTNTWAMGGGGDSSVKTIDYLETWCQNFNCFWRMDAAGAVHIKHFNWAAITADATMTAAHFLAFEEASDMSIFANRSRSKFGYGNAQWSSETVTDSTAGDYLPAAFVKERTEEYLFGAFGGATNPLVEKLKFYDRVRHIVKCSITLSHYGTFALGLLKVIDATHYNQQGAGGKYLVMEEEMDYINETVNLVLYKLWGV
jgi:hypothetical protein